VTIEDEALRRRCSPRPGGQGSFQTCEVRNTIAANILTGKTTTLISDPVIRLSLFRLMG
jgi:hypothetical protein